MSPSHRMPASDEEEKSELRSREDPPEPDQGPRMGYQQPFHRTKEGKVALLGALAVVIALLLVLVLDLGSGSVNSVKLYIDSNSGIDPEDSQLSFYVSITQGSLASSEGVKGTYTILYDDLQVSQANFEFGSQRTTRVDVPFDDFYTDNGEYTVRVKVGGQVVSDTHSLTRTVHGLQPEMIKLGDYFRLAMGFRPTAEPDDSTVVPAVGHGTVKYYFVDEENTTNEQPNANAVWQLMETVSYEIGLGELNWTIDSDGTTGTGLMDLPARYIDEDEQGNDNPNGTYAAQVSFTNTVSRLSEANPPELVALSNWLFVRAG